MLPILQAGAVAALPRRHHHGLHRSAVKTKNKRVAKTRSNKVALGQCNETVGWQSVVTVGKSPPASMPY